MAGKVFEKNARTTERLSNPLPERVLVVRALPGLGDLLTATPALRALRAALPHAHIALLGLPQTRSLANRFSHLLDDWIEFIGYPGLPERPFQAEQFPAFLTRVYEEKFDLAIQMHGNGLATNALTVLLGARRNAGFFLPGLYCPDPELFLPYPVDEPEVWRHLRLMEFLGLPLQGAHLEFPITDEDEHDFADTPDVDELEPGRYVCVHAGATDALRRWPTERFTAIADRLADAGYQVVLTGTTSERSLADRVARHMETRPISLAGRTSLGSLAVLLNGARLLICNDTGVSHLAAALRVPSVVIFTGYPGRSSPHRWAPLDRELHRAVFPPEGAQGAEKLREIAGLPCLKSDRVTHLDQDGTRFIAGVSVEDVWTQAQELLRREKVDVAERVA